MSLLFIGAEDVSQICTFIRELNAEYFDIGELPCQIQPDRNKFCQLRCFYMGYFTGIDIESTCTKTAVLDGDEAIVPLIIRSTGWNITVTYRLTYLKYSTLEKIRNGKKLSGEHPG